MKYQDENLYAGFINLVRNDGVQNQVQKNIVAYKSVSNSRVKYRYGDLSTTPQQHFQI